MAEANQHALEAQALHKTRMQKVLEQIKFFYTWEDSFLLAKYCVCCCEAFSPRLKNYAFLTAKSLCLPCSLSCEHEEGWEPMEGEEEEDWSYDDEEQKANETLSHYLRRIRQNGCFRDWLARLKEEP